MTGQLAEILTRAIRASNPTIEGSDEQLDSKQIDVLSSRIAEALGRRGVHVDEPVHITISNRPSDVAALLGIWRAGAVAVPVHASTPQPVLDSLQATTRARFLVCKDEINDIGSEPPPVRPLLKNAALVVFTSGSTGQPKGVVIGHDRFAGKLQVLSRLLAPRATDVVILPLQLTFIFGIWVSLLTVLAGGRLRLMAKFALDAVERELVAGATVIATVPTMLRAMTSEGSLSAPALRMVMTGGEPLGAPLTTATRMSLAGADLYDLYGLTETGSCDFSLVPSDQPAGMGTIGKPTEHVAFRVVAEDGKIAGLGVPGELQIRTPYGMLGYLDNPDLTNASFSDGYFRTGDLARVRVDGRIELVGRAKEIISRGGNKISPLEIDQVLASHPDVQAALCAGVPDQRLGETIHVVVVPRSGAELNVEALRDWAASRVERYKVPDVIHVADALPTGRTGKADRTAVAQLTQAVNLKAK